MSLKKIMKDIYLAGHGGFDKLEYREDIPVPELENNEVFKNIITYIENKEINPLVDRVSPLKNLIEAQKYFLKKNFIEKIVITVC
mgnify:CR=1 FL=1